MPAEWSPELILNDETLDADHVELFRRIAVAAGAVAHGRAALERAVGSLGDALVAHLAREERMMSLTGYPERDRHHIAHELFLSDFEHMRKALGHVHSPSDPVVVEWLETRIPQWLAFHIRVNDAPLAAWFARRTAPAPRGTPRPGSRRQAHRS